MPWVTPEQVAARLGPTIAADDPVIVEQTAAAIAKIRGARAGDPFIVPPDDPDIVPGADVAEGVILYAVSLYRQRAVVDGYANYGDLVIETPTSVWPRVVELCGLRRPGFG